MELLVALVLIRILASMFMIRNRYYKILTLLLVFSFLATMGIGCKGGSQEAKEAAKPITLKYWRVFDEYSAFDQIIKDYKVAHPNVSFDYRKFRLEEYETELLNAFAEDRGPDIFSIPAAWLGKHQSKLSAMPASITLPYLEIQGTIQKEQVTVLKTKPSISLRQLKDNFVETVYNDVTREVVSEDGKTRSTQVFGLPMSLDTLVLYYNRDLLNSAGIARVPTTWTDFQQAVIRLSRVDKLGNILQAGAALGTSNNVERPFDILSVLMMQNGTPMTETDGWSHFNEGDARRRAEEAIIFYTDFANPAKEVYCWDKTMPNAVDAFSQGKAAFFVGYNYHLPLIRARAPKLNFGIARLPQIGAEVNYANYWIEVVSKKSPNIDFAWDFVQFASDAKEAPNYLTVAKKPTALRGLIESQLQDLDLGIFASQVLTAKNWYRGKDAQTAEKAFAGLIDSVLAGVKINEALDLVVAKINQTLR